jgi:hypothetical protein
LRRLVGLVAVLALLAVGFSVIDVVVRKSVENSIATQIESRSPGSSAVVKIPSFPFLGHLAVSGTVPTLDADVTDVAAGPVEITHIDLDVTNLKLDRHQLLHNEVHPLSISSGQVVAVISQASLDALAHLSLRLGQGTISYLGLTIAVHLTIDDGAVVIALPHGLPHLRVAIPVLDVLPCVDAAAVVPGALQLSCHFTTLPGILRTTFHP